MVTLNQQMITIRNQKRGEQMKGENMKIIRLKKRFTQTALAKEVGVSRSTINKIENGHGNPSLELLERIAKTLDCSMKSFF